IAGVDQRDAGVEGGMNRGDALAAVGGTIHPRHAHAAEAKRGYRGPMSAQPTLLHFPCLLQRDDSRASTACASATMSSTMRAAGFTAWMRSTASLAKITAELPRYADAVNAGDFD